MSCLELREEGMRRREFIRFLGGASATIVALTGTASAQLMPGIDLGGSDSPPLTPEEQEKRKAVDDAYRSAIAKVPDKKKSADPWGDVRSTTTTPSKQRSQ
jgi:hypothetical protein